MACLDLSAGMARAWASRSGNQTTLALLHLPGLKRQSVREEAPTRAAGPEGGEDSSHRARGPTAVLQMGRPKHRHHSLGVPSVLESQTLRTGVCPGSSQTAKGRGPWGYPQMGAAHTLQGLDSAQVGRACFQARHASAWEPSSAQAHSTSHGHSTATAGRCKGEKLTPTHPCFRKNN